MCSYNKINGSYGSEHYDLLTRILKEEWGLEGFVVSDWGAVAPRDRTQGRARSWKHGPRARRTQAVIDAVHDGDLDESVLDEAGTAVFCASSLRRPRRPKVVRSTWTRITRWRQCIVLLKNNGILPLKPNVNLAVIGHAAEVAGFRAAAAGTSTPPVSPSPLPN